MTLETRLELDLPTLNIFEACPGPSTLASIVLELGSDATSIRSAFIAARESHALILDQLDIPAQVRFSDQVSSSLALVAIMDWAEYNLLSSDSRLAVACYNRETGGPSGLAYVYAARRVVYLEELNLRADYE